MCLCLFRQAIRDQTPWIADSHRSFYITIIVHFQGHLVADTRISQFFLSNIDKLALIVKVNCFKRMDKEHSMFVVSPGLQLFDGVVTLRDRIWPVRFLTQPSIRLTVKRIDFLAEYSTLQRPAGFADFFNSQIFRQYRII